MEMITRVADKSGALGSLVAAMGCAMCFPALASVASALGLGFLAQWESTFINTLLPAFAVIALAANALGWLAHRQWHRSLLGMVGPSLVLLTLYPLWKYSWSTYLLYTGLGLMLAIAAWDIYSPATRHCISGTPKSDQEPTCIN